MKVLYNWIKEFVPLEITAEQAADTLRKLGFEIASLQHLGGDLSGVVSAEVNDVQKHPNADRLSVCTVTDGQQIFSVVCGAANVRAGIRVPLARVGAVLPGGKTIGAANLRGVESQGMICSAAELGMETVSDGILILDQQTPLGADIRSLLNLDDTLIDLENTPNRRDALSVIGIARELSAALNITLKNPEPRVRELEIANSFAVSNEAPDLCPRYIARMLREVRVGPSPDWMVRRLNRCGIRSINNIVDITNYIMLELGQPLHAFDGMKLRGRRLRIRLAREGESLQTLEGKTVPLETDILIIADEDKPAAIAGIIGGEVSRITEDTTEVVIESAAFSPALVRKTSRKLGISTESSFRFERGNDWNAVAVASARAAQLIQELASGIGYKPIESSPRPHVPIAIKLHTDRVRKMLGLDLKEAVVADTLRRLGCIINMGSGQLLVTIPTWRMDLTTPADLLEEIARVHGYENIPTRFPMIRWTSVPDDAAWSFERRLSEILIGLGFSEAQNYSFVNEKQSAFFSPGLGRPSDALPITLANPLSQELGLLRTSLLPGLLQNALTNFNHQINGVHLFELGRIFDQNRDGCQEVHRLGILQAGDIQPPHWRQKPKKAEFYDLLGHVESFLRALRIPEIEKTPCIASAFHPGRSATLIYGDTVLGWMGEIHPDLVRSLDAKEPLVAAELDIAALMRVTPPTTHYSPLSAFPPVHRDLSLIVSETTTFETVLKTLRSAAGPVLESSVLIDLYRDKTIGAGKKSFTLSLLFRHRERTLKDAEVDRLLEKTKTDLQKKCEAKIRE